MLGHPKGSYEVIHPLNHVNMSQSTNDVYPSALRLTLSKDLDQLVQKMRILQRSLAAKAVEFSDVIKMGRTQLQDAVPMTLGQEFEAYAIMIEEDIARVVEAQALIYEINTEIAQEAMESGRAVYEIVLEKGYLTKVQLDEILSPENMTRPRYIHRR